VTSNPFAPGQPWLADQLEAVAPVQHTALFPPVEAPEPAELPELVIRVVGEPVPQGSMTGVAMGRRVRIFADNEKILRPWRDAVTEAARATANRERWTRLDGAIEVGIVFFLDRPAAAPRRRIWPEKRPDLDKLTRAVGDALTDAGVLHDDARIVHLDVWKRYAPDGVPLGARITVRNGVDEARPVVSVRASRGAQ
jgi:Holliday junction resolvase RusA-like endonuclease